MQQDSQTPVQQSRYSIVRPQKTAQEPANGAFARISVSKPTNQDSGIDDCALEDPRPGQSVGGYKLVRAIGSGGMAIVYEAHPLGEPDKRVAVKVLRHAVSKEQRFQTMLANEARIAGSINHANVCRFYKHGQDNGHYYIAMEHLTGMPLSTILRTMQGLGKRLQVAHVLALFLQVCDGISAAHEQPIGRGLSGVIHRDISPENLFATKDGVVKVLDFGISKAEWVSSNTRTGTIKGKLSYMSPEQANGEEIDIRTDIFSLGVVLFELLTSRSLFQRSTPLQTYSAVTSEKIPNIQEYRNIPAGLAAVVGRALARKKEERFSTVTEFADAVRDAVTGTVKMMSNKQLGRLVEKIQGLSASIAQQHDVVSLPNTQPAPARAQSRLGSELEETTVVTSRKELDDLVVLSNPGELLGCPTMVADAARLKVQTALLEEIRQLAGPRVDPTLSRDSVPEAESATMKICAEVPISWKHADSPELAWPQGAQEISISAHVHSDFLRILFVLVAATTLCFWLMSMR